MRLNTAKLRFKGFRLRDRINLAVGNANLSPNQPVFEALKALVSFIHKQAKHLLSQYLGLQCLNRLAADIIQYYLGCTVGGEI